MSCLRLLQNLKKNIKYLIDVDMMCIVLYSRKTATVNIDSKGNLTSLYFTADAMSSNRSDVAESLFQNQGCIVQIISRLLL
jgi:hypothetical protein